MWLRGKVKELLEERVEQGASMFYIFDRDHYGNFFYFALLDDLIGAEFRGFLAPKEWQVETGDLMQNDLWFKGKAIKTELDTGQAQGTVSYQKKRFNPWWRGWFTKKEETPAIINNHYGQGEVYSLTFDPVSMMEDQEQEVQELFTSITTQLRPEESLFSLELDAENIGDEDAQLKYVFDLPLNFTAVDSPEYQVEDNQISKEFNLEEADEVELMFFAVSSVYSCNYQLEPKLYYEDGNGNWKLYKNWGLDCEVR